MSWTDDMLMRARRLSPGYTGITDDELTRMTAATRLADACAELDRLDDIAPTLRDFTPEAAENEQQLVHWARERNRLLREYRRLVTSRELSPVTKTVPAPSSDEPE